MSVDYLKYVNIKQGTKSTKRFSNGNTLPLVQLPFGFSSFAPQTDSERGAWFYHPDDMSFEGIRLTHQPSPWIMDHGALVICPQSEKPYADADLRWSSFDNAESVLMPHYMRYCLNRGKTKVELTPTEYGGYMRLSFDNDEKNYLSFLAVSGRYTYRFDKEKNRLYCHTDCNELKGYDSDRFIAFFVIEFESGAVDADGIIAENSDGRSKGCYSTGENAAIHVLLKTKMTTLQIATSYIGYEQAEMNLSRESGVGFDELTEKNKLVWNSYLSRIDIKADEETKRTFYSCLYRVFLFPHKAYEPDINGCPVHYSPSKGCAAEGVRYTDNGFWDTYRTVYPLLSLIAEDEMKEMLEGFVADYREGGWLPCWTALDAKKCMPSTLIDAVITDAAAKGIIGGELLETAFEGMEKHANTPSVNPAYGRAGCEYYTKLGYVPCDKYNESVNLTLDAAYGDWCLAVVADILGHKEKAKRYGARSKNYRHIFDRETGFMRGRTEGGGFRPNFNPNSWGLDYTEASAWQTSFAVQHDLDGLAELFGGRGKLLKMLDRFFAAKPEFKVGGYGREIHEMSEFAAGDWGQCAISNQPSFHIPFVYAYFGETKKCEYWVERICREGFSAADDGFPGDEDNGTMAAWYIFAVIGMYPLCPGRNEYIKIKPLAESVKINC